MTMVDGGTFFFYNVRPPVDSVQLVYNSNNYIWFMVLITIVFMGFMNQLITGGLTLYPWSFGTFHDISPVFMLSNYIYLSYR